MEASQYQSILVISNLYGDPKDLHEQCNPSNILLYMVHSTSNQNEQIPKLL